MKNSVGVIVGRFQVPELHEGHQHLLKTVFEKHDIVIIIIGTSEARLTQRDPLDFQSRVYMLRTWIHSNCWGKTVIHCEHADRQSDEAWNQALDDYLDRKYPNHPKVLYGSRDSFLDSYSGKHWRCEITSVGSPSGTEVRNEVLSEENHSADFRKGMIYAANHRYPTVYSTVDVALIDNFGQLLLGRKKDEKQFRLIGGFVDPADASIENAACREVFEETLLSIVPRELQYLGSARIEDWRYKNTQDSIMTHIFCTNRNDLFRGQTAKANDDIEQVHGFFLDHAYKVIIPEHIPLLHKVRDYMQSKGMRHV